MESTLIQARMKIQDIYEAQVEAAVKVRRIGVPYVASVYYNFCALDTIMRDRELLARRKISISSKEY